jgi:hypothetical protein
VANQFKAFRVGPLCVEPINRALATELDNADVWVSKACHEHIARDHPEDYALIMANFIDIVRSPTFAGQDPKHGENFYLVKRIPTDDENEHVLVAIGLTLTPHGTYSVRTAYRINQDDIDRRRQRQSLKPILPR